MRADVLHAASCGAHGVVLGMLDAAGRVATDQLRPFVELCSALGWFVELGWRVISWAGGLQSTALVAAASRSHYHRTCRRRHCRAAAAAPPPSPTPCQPWTSPSTVLLPPPLPPHPPPPHAPPQAWTSPSTVPLTWPETSAKRWTTWWPAACAACCRLVSPAALCIFCFPVASMLSSGEREQACLAGRQARSRCQL